ncbi:feline leukemia virus subgroup C receptor-related protein 2-like protein [Leptotrombidium deliense]|uniref:Feline leukemia virus subgroup C receptor-related protein 2-like protein n=1 Tax=Leptotrombidium deliense TaxID=299467 RepID=A0A443RYL6_9ACAR|nr:feline leukemia virus subgroup C receptor-related protein 2-like protein [Leptotrombidium deliense]
MTQFVSEITVTAIESGLRTFFYYQAGVSIFIFVCVLLVFDEKPKTPPSRLQRQAEVHRQSLTFWSSLKKIMTRNFSMLFVAVMCYTCTSRTNLNLCNQIFTQYFPKKVNVVGTMMLSASIANVCSSIFYGIVLDKFGGYKILFNVLNCN